MKKIFLLIIAAIIIYIVIYISIPENPLPKNISIDELVVFKSKKQLIAYAQNKPIKTYSISLGSSPVGPKRFKDDNKTPEGKYIIYDKNAGSGYHKNLGVSYPNSNDISFAKRQGLEAGGDIKIHGFPNNLSWLGKVQKIHRFFGWTRGCVALTNTEVDELFNAVAVGTSIIIYP